MLNRGSLNWVLGVLYVIVCTKPCAECSVNLCGFWPPGENKMVSSTYVVQQQHSVDISCNILL